MVRIKMYIEIQNGKSQGKTIRQLARDLSLDRKTVAKYYHMKDEEFRDLQHDSQNRSKIFDKFMDEILEIYETNFNKKLNVSSVYDFLEEKHGVLPGTEKTLRNFIAYLIKAGKLEFRSRQRVYGMVDELPPGKQMQLDFGQYTCPSGLKLYIFAVVLSSSRYKYAAFQDHPFTTVDVIVHLLNCFDFLGGIPLELVIDQDAVLVVSENHGDIIYTKDFREFVEEMELDMYVCRKADPESKGKIENFVKFIKQNFLNSRDFKTVDEANRRLQGWLARRANGKICQATRQLPQVLFQDEKDHLRPLRNSIYRRESLAGREIRLVNDKCHISVLASQYGVPSRFRNRQVEVYITSRHLFIYDETSGKQVARYELSPIPGRIVSKREFIRQNDRSSRELREEVEKISHLSAWQTFLEENRERYGRYQRDQHLDALRHFKDIEIEDSALSSALQYCLENSTLTYANLHDSYCYFACLSQVETTDHKLPETATNLNRYTKHPSPPVQTRDLDRYALTVRKMGGRR